MTWADIVKNVEAIALLEPSVNSVGKSRTLVAKDANETVDMNYPNFYLVPGLGSVTKNLIAFTFDMVYIDRIDDIVENDTEIQSTAFMALQNITNRINADQFDGASATQYPFTVTFFYEKQGKDNCQGAHVSITLQVKNDLGHCTGL